MRVLKYYETEMGKTLRQTLTELHKIPVAQLLPPTRMEVANTFAPHYALYSYVRPSNGETLYFVEVELFTPPDMQWWRTWLLDARPSLEQIETLIETDAQEGSAL